MTTLEEEARRIIRLAASKDLVLRVFGGIAVGFHCEHASHKTLSRTYGDFDLMALKGDYSKIKRFFEEELGYIGHKMFNAINAKKRAIFYSPDGSMEAEIFFDQFEMCHTLRFDKKRLLADPNNLTIPIAELVLTKLQVIELTEKDIKDTVALFIDHVFSDHDKEAINVRVITKLLAIDWGWWRTVTENLQKVKTFIKDYDLEPEHQKLVNDRLDQLQKAIANEPKSRKWKMRARIGEKKRWYTIPEVGTTYSPLQDPASPKKE